MQKVQGSVNLEARQIEVLRRWAYEERRSMSSILRELIDREAERRKALTATSFMKGGDVNV